MSLSIEKLEKLIIGNNAIITRFYGYHKLIRYIECVDLQSKEYFMLYIPDDYDFSVNDAESFIPLKRIEANDYLSYSEKYAQDMETKDIQKIYTPINVNQDVDITQKPQIVEENMVDNYNRMVSLHGRKASDYSLQDIRRQVDRLRLCLNNTKFRWCISYDRFLVINRETDEVCFLKKDGTIDKTRKIFVLMDLASFVKDRNFSNILPLVYNGLKNILTNTIETHTTIYDQLGNRNISSASILKSVKDLKDKFDNYHTEFTKIESVLQKKEEEAKISRENILRKKSGNFTSDFRRTNMLQDEERKIRQIEEDQEKLMEKVLQVRIKERELFLMIDKILFDNIVILSTLRDNLVSLTELLH